MTDWADKYFAWLDKAGENWQHAIDALNEEMPDLNWQIYNTGGGCLAIEATDKPRNRYYLLTNEEPLHTDRTGSDHPEYPTYYQWVFGIYDEEDTVEQQLFELGGDVREERDDQGMAGLVREKIEELS